jgi:hypothetical protein
LLLPTDGRIQPEVLSSLRARHDYRVGRLPKDMANGLNAAAVAAELRTELIAVEREFIHRPLRDGKITDEARRRMEHELDLEEASVACRKEGGAEPAL